MQKLHELNVQGQFNPVRTIDRVEPVDEAAIASTFKHFMRTWTHAHKGLVYQSLQNQDLNYLTACYHLIKKHEMS